MKKIISLILAVTLILSCIPVFAEDVEAISEKADTKYEDMVSLLKLTGIANEDFTVTEEAVTRGRFASMLTASKGMNVLLGEYNTNPFADVNSDSAYAKEIAVAKDMNLINGYSDGNFRPDNTITVLEAAICFIRALGYGIKAEGLGGYPNGYYSVIRETELLKGVSGAYTDNLTVKDAVTLIYNALHTKIMAPVSFGDESRYEVQDGRTLIYDSFGIAFIEGIVNGVDITNLFGENDLPYYSVYIGKDVFYTGPYSMNDMLEYNVRAYYIHEDSKDKIKLAVKLPNKNNEEVIDISDIVTIKDGTVETIDYEGNEQTYKYNLTAPVIYNGTNTKSDFDTDIYKDGDKVLSGTVKLLDNNNDKKADVIFIDAYENMIIGRVDTDKGYVYDYFNASRKHLLSTDTDEPYVLIYDSEGEEMDVASLVRGDSITIYKSKPDAWQTFVKAYVSAVTVTGKINGIQDVEGKTVITIEDKDYILSDYAKDNGMSVVAGRTATVLLNKFGEIARFTYSTQPGDYDFGMLCAARTTDDYEENFHIKMMDNTGYISNIITADKLKVDGIIYDTTDSDKVKTVITLLKNASKEITETENGNYCFQMVKFGINTEGKINYIDTILDKDGLVTAEDKLETDNEIFFGLISGDQSKYYNSTGMIAQKVMLSDDVKVFMYPQKGNETDAKYYSLRDRSFFTDSTDYEGIVYFKDNNEGFDAPVFMKQYVSTEIKGDISGMKTSVITKVTDTVNEDGDARKKWYLYSQGVNSTCIVDPDLKSSTSVKEEIVAANTLKPGDIIYYTQNSVTGEVEGFLLAYSDFSKKIYNITASYNGIEKAHALKSTQKGIKLLYDSSIKNDFETDRKLYYLVFNNFKNANGITVFDTKTNKARQGTFNDIIGYEEDKTGYTNDLIVRWYQPTTKVIREIYVFKR